ncbi:NAD(P)-dependent oxidoreductase [Yoonia sp. SS1-5]|uniref:NAD(P)-dependent oxidoreductase n=1 Tax=Yoonia rhodophyticola TaxID=3137370 RepID=A0AAN0MBP0_9RHOB
MTKPTLILDPDWRQMDELFSPAARSVLFATYTVIWGQDGPIPHRLLHDELPNAAVLIAANPVVDQATIDRAPHLKAVIEVSGSFPDTIDYAACAAAGIEVLTCAPGFRQSVAEMGLAMALAGGRGLVSEHEAFRHGRENWLSDNENTDFTLFGARVGFIGFGQIAQEICRLMAPFAPDILAYDPWLPDAVATQFGAQLTDLDDVLAQARCLFVAAVPTRENHHLLGADKLALMPQDALLILLSRAHLVDFAALTECVRAGRIRAAIDVFPHEPVPADDPIRQLGNAIFSPHRAAAVAGGRQLIGDMIIDDLAHIMAGDATRRLGLADAEKIASLAGVGDAAQVTSMAKER